MKSVYVNINGIFEVESDKETRQEVLEDVGESVSEESILEMEVIIKTGSGKIIRKRLEDFNTEIGIEVFDEDGMVLD